MLQCVAGLRDRTDGSLVLSAAISISRGERKPQPKT
jgi:hypothetical protein